MTDRRVKAVVVNKEKDFLVHKAEWPPLTWEMQRFLINLPIIICVMDILKLITPFIEVALFWGSLKEI